MVTNNLMVMKKGFLLGLLFLVSCIQVVSPPPSATPSFTPSPSISLTASPSESSPTPPATPSPTISPSRRPQLLPFDYLLLHFPFNDQCPHFCWLGINPGVTSAAEARTLLEASEDIDRVEVSETQIQAHWIGSPVSIRLEKNLVKTIYIGNLTGFTFTPRDFIQLLGEPQEIRVVTYIVPHCQGVAYLVYYASPKLVLEVIHAAGDGPNPNDWIYSMTLNTEFDDEALRDEYLEPMGETSNYYSERQPWLGYGHLPDYLPGESLPTVPCVPPGAAP